MSGHSSSFSGVSLSYQGEDRFVQDSGISTRIVSPKYPPPRDATFLVVRDDPARGMVWLKFYSIDDG
jgi:hypothetical protein